MPATTSSTAGRGRTTSKASSATTPYYVDKPADGCTRLPAAALTSSTLGVYAWPSARAIETLAAKCRRDDALALTAMPRPDLIGNAGNNALDGGGGATTSAARRQ